MHDAPFSFELYPPRGAAAAAALPATIDALAAAGPEFISVTYGAGGSSHDSSLDVVRYIAANTAIAPMAHLTCVGSSHEQATALIREFLDSGVHRFLALRGDPPSGIESADADLGDLHSAGELVQLIHRVQAERMPYSEVSIPGIPQAHAVRTKRERVTIAVAAFPNGHPRSRSVDQDIDALLAKQAAGANLGITQLFFHADDYFAFAARAKHAGVRFPILPGVMPVTSPARLRKMLELSGEDLPSELAIRLQIEPSAAGQREVGIEHAARFTAELIAGGAPGIHLYTFNQADTVLAVLERSGINSTAPDSTAPDSTATEKEPA